MTIFLSGRNLSRVFVVSTESQKFQWGVWVPIPVSVNSYLDKKDVSREKGSQTVSLSVWTDGKISETKSSPLNDNKTEKLRIRNGGQQ